MATKRKTATATARQPKAVVNLFTDTDDFKTIKLTSDIWSDSLYAVYTMLQYYNRRQVISDVTIQNFNSQSIGNRNNPMRVDTLCKLTVNTRKIFQVSNPVGFIPARLGIGYQPDDKITMKKNTVKQVWSRAMNRSFKDSTSESLSWMGYFITQLISGQLISSESAFKTDGLNTMLSVIKPSVLTVVCYPRINDNDVKYTYELPDVESLIKANLPRVRLIHSLPERSNVRTTKGKLDQMSV